MPDNEAAANGEGTSVTLQEMLIMIGAKEVELQKQRSTAETMLARKDAEIKALRAECARLRVEGGDSFSKQAVEATVVGI